MYVDVGLDATANSEITFHLMVNFSYPPSVLSKSIGDFYGKRRFK
jgi:hypothetical protein